MGNNSCKRQRRVKNVQYHRGKTTRAWKHRWRNEREYARQLGFLLVQAVKFLDRGARTGVLDGGLIVLLPFLLLSNGL